MSRWWKSLVVMSLALNGISLFYVYALNHPNPYGQQYYELERIKTEIHQLQRQITEIKETQTTPAS